MQQYFEGLLGCLPFSAPLNAILADDDVVQPDVVVVSRVPQISSRGIKGAPEVLADILLSSLA